MFASWLKNRLQPSLTNGLGGGSAAIRCQRRGRPLASQSRWISGSDTIEPFGGTSGKFAMQISRVKCARVA